MVWGFRKRPLSDRQERGCVVWERGIRTKPFRKSRKFGVFPASKGGGVLPR